MAHGGERFFSSLRFVLVGAADFFHAQQAAQTGQAVLVCDLATVGGDFAEDY
jgi:hypothetical protein